MDKEPHLLRLVTKVVPLLRGMPTMGYHPKRVNGKVTQSKGQRCSMQKSNVREMVEGNK